MNPDCLKFENLNLLSDNVPTILLLLSIFKYTSLLRTLFVHVSDVLALFDIAIINDVVIEVLSPIGATISCNVLRTSGAVPTSLLISARTSAFVYASMPLIVSLLSSDDKLIFVPGTRFSNIFPNKNVFEFPRLHRYLMLLVWCLPLW